jgi:hypothetical protein
MSALRFRGPILPDGESRDLYVVRGTITYEPQPGAETVVEGWIVPGSRRRALPSSGWTSFGAVDAATRPRRRRSPTATGAALLIRDAGSAADTRWIEARDDLPRLIRCRPPHRPQPKRYIRHFAREVEPEELRLADVRAGGAGRGRLGQARRRLDRPG